MQAEDPRPVRRLIPYSRPQIIDEDMAAVCAVVASGQFDSASVARAFRKAIARRLRIPPGWVALTNSCTAALQAAHWAVTARGSEGIAAPVMTWPSTYSWGQLQELLDVRPDGFVQAGKSSGNTIIPVELFGRRAKYEDLKPLKAQYRWVILDAAQNILDEAHVDHLKAGVIDAVCYSFGAIKQLTCGHGGCAIFPEAHARLEAYLDSGTIGRDKIQPRGYNFAMGEIAAALGLSQLQHFTKFQDHRWHILDTYVHTLGDRMLTKPGTHSGHLAVVRVPAALRPKISYELWRAGYQTTVHYHLPQWISSTHFPVAAQLEAEVLTIPCHLWVTLSQAQQIAAIIKKELQ